MLSVLSALSRGATTWPGRHGGPSGRHARDLLTRPENTDLRGAARRPRALLFETQFHLRERAIEPCARRQKTLRSSAGRLAGSKPIDPRDDREDWRALLKAAGVRETRVHDARHSAGALLLEQGIDVGVVQQILGHSQLSQTQRYTHVTAKLTQHAADQMGKALWT